MPDYTQEFTTIPYGPLGIIALPGCEELAQKIDRYLVKWRAQKQSEHKNSLSFAGYERDTYIIDASFPRFGSGLRYFYCMRYVQLRRDLQYVRSNNFHESGRAFCQP